MNYARNGFDILLGTTILLIGVVGGVIISNKIILLFTDNKELNFLILLAYLSIIIMFILSVQHILNKVIVNPKILHAIESLIGPIIGISSLFLAPTIKSFVEQI